MRILNRVSLLKANDVLGLGSGWYCSQKLSRNQYCLNMQAFDVGVMQPLMDTTSQIISSSEIDSSLSLSAKLINAWSVNGQTLDSPDLASSIFSVSILPYLALLFFLSRKETNIPKLSNFGFQFLLVFVFATIPAGIIAKSWYHDTLANVDYLHGLAESLLTVTNILIVSGFFFAKFQKPDKAQLHEQSSRTSSSMSFPEILRSSKDIILLFFALILGHEFIDTAFSEHQIDSTFLSTVPAITSYLSYHNEPSNALSLPTWIVHTSSLLEWVLAMRYIWEYAEVSKNPRWKGMTWAMIPSHFSGLCAVTYHIFFNSPAFIWLVNLQALSTIIGNSAMAFAAYRIWDYGKNHPNIDTQGKLEEEETKSITQSLKLKDVDDNAEDASGEITDPKILFTNLVLKSSILAVMIKYGELIFNFPFDVDNNQMAFMLILIPTISIVAKWTLKSQKYSLL